MGYECPKCHNTTYDVGEMRATGGTLSKILTYRIRNLPLLPAKNALIPSFLKLRQAL